MEDCKSGTRSRSTCRLAVQGNPGRVRYVLYNFKKDCILQNSRHFSKTVSLPRWLIGNEKHWRSILKVLASITIIIMCALFIAIALPRVVTAKRTARSTELSKSNIPAMRRDDFQHLLALAQAYHYNEALDRETKNELLHQIRTTYTPPQDVPLKQSLPNAKQRRNRRRRMPVYKASGRIMQPSENRRIVRRKVALDKSEFMDYESLWKKQLNASEVRRIQGKCFRKV